MTTKLQTMILTHKVLQFSSLDDINPYTYGLYDNQEVAQSVADDWNVIYQNAQNGWFAKVELVWQSLYSKGNSLMNETLKTQAVVEALEFYIQNLKDHNCTQSSIDLYTQVLKEVDSELQHSVL